MININHLGKQQSFTHPDTHYSTSKYVVELPQKLRSTSNLKHPIPGALK
jgi:hypothetical protein